MSVKSIPDGYHIVTPFLLVDDIDKMIEFLNTVFDVEVKNRLQLPDGNVMDYAFPKSWS